MADTTIAGGIEVPTAFAEFYGPALERLCTEGYDARFEELGGGTLGIVIDLGRPPVERDNGVFTDHVLVTDTYGPFTRDGYEGGEWVPPWLIGLYTEANEWTAEDGTPFMVEANDSSLDALVTAVKAVLS